MEIYVGAVLLIIVIILSILLILGLPLGELTMGGRYKVWPKELRAAAIGQLLVQGFALNILLAAGGKCDIFMTERVTKIICIAFAVFFIANTIMNFFSTSRKEKLVMTPMSAISAVCFAIAAFHM